MCAISLCAGWAKHMMYLLCMSHFHAFSVHMYVFSHILIIVNCFATFFIVFFSFPLLLVTLVVSMAPKRKSTPVWNPLHSGASSSSDHAHLSLRFCNDDAYKALTENFSWWGIHSECRVILGHFADIDIPIVIHSREWESLCDELTSTFPLFTVPYLILLLVSEVFLFLSHRNLLRMCLGFLG